MSAMTLTFHGGQCCGIKTIYGFYGPTDMMYPARVAQKADDSDQLSRVTKTTDSFFTPAAPAETAASRLDRYIAFVKSRRPRHLIEVTLALNSQAVWIPELEKRGFTMVSKFVNSNTHNVVGVFHLVIGEKL